MRYGLFASQKKTLKNTKDITYKNGHFQPGNFRSYNSVHLISGKMTEIDIIKG